MSYTPGVSAVLIVKNEENFIARALQSLLWCNEIIVLDSGSTDRTQEIALDSKAPWAHLVKWDTQTWKGYSDQRNDAIARASYSWTFVLDADEACSPELAKKTLSISQSLETTHSGSGSTLSQYLVRRQEFFLGKPIHYSIWNPSFHVRFFPTGQAKFIGTIHEGVESALPRAKIDEPILHSEMNFSRFFKKMISYTELQAQEDIRRGFRTHSLKIALAFPAMFLKNFFYYKGYKDGYAGFIISILEGISRTVRHLHIYQLQRSAKKLLAFILCSSLAASCAIHKPCSEAGDVTWNPPIVGDKMCKQKKNNEGRLVNEGTFIQTYQTTGKVALEGQFEEGRKTGIWLYYGEDQKLKAAKYFEKGVEKTPSAEVQKKIDLIIHQKNSVLNP